MILARGIVGEVVVGRGVRDARSLDARNFDAGGLARDYKSLPIRPVPTLPNLSTCLSLDTVSISKCH